MSTQFNGQKHFYFKLFKQLYTTIQLNVNTVLMWKNSSISNNSVKHKNAGLLFFRCLLLVENQPGQQCSSSFMCRLVANELYYFFK